MKHFTESAATNIAKGIKRGFKYLPDKFKQYILNAWAWLVKQSNNSLLPGVGKQVQIIAENGGYDFEKADTYEKIETIAKAKLQLFRIRFELRENEATLNEIEQLKLKYCGI